MLAAPVIARLLLRRAAADPVPTGRRARVVALDGRSGAGKTVLARALARALGGVPVVALEDTYPGWDGLDAAVPRLVEGVLRPLTDGGGRPAVLPGWDWGRGVEGPAHEVVPAGGRPPFVVVEGAGAGALACAPHLWVLLWLDAPAALRRARAMARDGDTYRPHWDRWAAQEERYLARDRVPERADALLAPAPAGRPGYLVSCGPGTRGTSTAGT